MSLSTRLLLGFLSLCLPLAAAAAEPGSVTGIKASMQGGKVLVTWTPNTDQHIALYRVFFGHQSILRSGGQYDDYDTVDGSVNSYAIVNTPTSDTVFVSVLAMNDQGQESASFVEEASVQLHGGIQTPPVTMPTSSAATSMDTSMPTMPPAVSQPVQTMAPPAVAESQVRLLSVRTLSATGVELTFSQTVTVDAAIAAHAFEIRSGSGKQLALTRLFIQGNIVRIDTTPQERGSVYALILGTGIMGQDAVSGAMIPIDPSQPPMLFSGSPDGITPVVESAGSSSSSAAPAVASYSDIAKLSLRAQEEKKGLYSIQATWDIPNDALLVGFEVTQTTDRGLTYGQANNLPATTNSVTIPHVPGGSYGLMVRAVYGDGTLSKGVQKIVELAGKPTSTLPASVITKPTNTHLPQTGPGAWVVMLMLGSALGYAGMRRYGYASLAQA